MEHRISDAVAEQAGFWDARLRAPDCTDADRARFAEWRDAHPEYRHREAFETIQAVVSSFRSNMGRADVRAVRDAALAAVRRRRRKRAWTAAAMIATLAVAATISATLQDRIWRAPLAEFVAMTDALLGRGRARMYATDVGQRSTVTLQDGSSVELNSKTRIRVAFDAATRSVELLEGQAFFHVAKHPARPFIVRAAGRDIIAVGTAFDVRLNATSVRVTLLEGKVKITREESWPPAPASTDAPAIPDSAQQDAVQLPSQLRQRSGVAPLQAAEQPHARREDGREEGESPSDLYLTPGQQFVARLSDDAPPSATNGARADRPGEAAAVRSVDVAKVVGWRSGQVFLEDLTLADAVAEMNRHSLVQIRVMDPEIARLRVNGMFRAGEQDGFVSALEQYFPIVAAQHNGEMEIILARRQ